MSRGWASLVYSILAGYFDVVFGFLVCHGRVNLSRRLLMFGEGSRVGTAENIGRVAPCFSMSGVCSEAVRWLKVFMHNNTDRRNTRDRMISADFSLVVEINS